MILYFLPFLSALLLYLASPAPEMVALSWISLLPLFLFLRLAKPKQAFWSGWCAGTCYYLLIIYWVTISMETYGGLAPWLSISALVLLCTYMGLYQGLFCFITARILRKNPSFPIWFAACLWVSLDYVRSFLFTGLPWMDIGYFHYQSTISQLADLGGHYGITFLVVLVNGVLVRFYQDRLPSITLRNTSPAVLCIIIAFSYPYFRLPQIAEINDQSPTLQTSVIQGNIEQPLKWKSDNKLTSVNKYINLTEISLQEEQPPKLVIWPETALPFYPTFDPIFYHVQAETILKENTNYELLCGAPHIIRKEKGYDLYNAALILRPDKTSDYYFKQHLVPFGEYIPLRSILPFPKAIVESIGDFTAGTKPAVLQSKHAKIGVLICVEAIYPDLARKQVSEGAELLANITNDAWFGRSSAPTQHLAMAIFRAIENRRSLARSANTGISALISPTGEILDASSLFTEATLTQPLPLLNDRTIFNRFGYLFPIFCLVMTIILFIRPSQSNPLVRKLKQG